MFSSKYLNASSTNEHMVAGICVYVCGVWGGGWERRGGSCSTHLLFWMLLICFFPYLQKPNLNNLTTILTPFLLIHPYLDLVDEILAFQSHNFCDICPYFHWMPIHYPSLSTGLLFLATILLRLLFLLNLGNLVSYVIFALIFTFKYQLLFNHSKFFALICNASPESYPKR